MRARLPTHRNRRALMTINARGTRKIHAPRLLAAALVITSAVIFGREARAEASAQSVKLTTAPAPLLATVVVDGSSGYDAARLFAAYRDQLGREISRASARAIVDALLALYELDGFVRPEI